MSTLDADFQTMLELQAKAMEGQPQPSLDDLPPDMIRAGYRMQRAAHDPNPPKDVEARDLKVAGAEGEVPARLYTPPGVATPSGLLVYFHGGGFVIGDLETHDGHCRRLAKEAWRPRAGGGLSPGARAPVPGRPRRCAGGHEVGLRPRGGAGRRSGPDRGGRGLRGRQPGRLDRHRPEGRSQAQARLPAAALSGHLADEETASRKALDGPILTKAALAWFDKCLGANGHPQVHRAKLGGADVAGVAPALVVTAGFDPLKDEGREYAERLKAAGVEAKHVEHPSLIHDFFVMAGVSPSVELALGETAAYLRGAIGG
jgi:acetyl esterase